MDDKSAPKRPSESSSGTGLAVVSMAAALAGLAAVQLLMETPRSRERLTTLWPGVEQSAPLSPIRTVSAEIRETAAPALPRALPTSALLLQPAPVERDVTGSIPTTEVSPGPAMTTTRSSFGADIGGSSNIRDIRALWASIQPGLLERGRLVQPLLVFQDGAPAQQLRLVIGPVSNAADVATLCAMMPSTIEGCTVVPYDGQKLPTN